MKVFYQNGFHNTGLDLILKESGISRMTLYNHFKSKDDLIVAALRRRDEIFRNRLMKHAESISEDPIKRIMGVFSYHKDWFNEDDFQGCMFINASAEFIDPDCAVRRVASDHKTEIVRYLTQLCEAAGLKDPRELAQQLNLVLEGAIVNAHVVCKVLNNEHITDEAADRATRMAVLLINHSR